MCMYVHGNNKPTHHIWLCNNNVNILGVANNNMHAGDRNSKANQLLHVM